MIAIKYLSSCWSRLSGRTYCRALLTLAAVLPFTVPSAHAQFNGPPPGLIVPMDFAAPQVLTTDESVLYPPASNNPLRPGDTINVRIYDVPDYTYSARISRDGTAPIPLLGLVPLAGLTLTQAEDFLAEKFVAAGMFNDPLVLIQTTDGPGQNITVIGETHGVVPAIGAPRLMEVLSATGGLPSTVSHIITILRPGVNEPIVVNLGNDPARSARANIPIFAGDTVITSRVGIVYVLGAFKATGIVPLNNYGPLTLTQLTALSSGTNYTGRFDDLRIIRTVGNRRTVARFDIKKVINGKAPDPVLQANDIVYLPNSTLKSFFLGGTLNTLLGFVSLAISLEAIR